MPRISKEEMSCRREEIINTCERLYKTKSFKEITIKDIGAQLPFTRTAIYSYFQTKEEIFLALLQREYELWICDIDEIHDKNETLTHDELAKRLAQSLEKRDLLLKLMSMNNFDMEEESRVENLTDFKRAYGGSLRAVKRCFDKFLSDRSEKERQDMLYSFFPFMFGIYPYTCVTDKQRSAMEQADVGFIYSTIYELTYRFLGKLFGGA